MVLVSTVFNAKVVAAVVGAAAAAAAAAPIASRTGVDNAPSSAPILTPSCTTHPLTGSRYVRAWTVRGSSDSTNSINTTASCAAFISELRAIRQSLDELSPIGKLTLAADGQGGVKLTGTYDKATVACFRSITDALGIRITPTIGSSECWDG